MISLSAAGRQLCERTIPWAVAVEENLLAGVDEADAEVVRRVLKRIARKLDSPGQGEFDLDLDASQGSLETESCSVEGREEFVIPGRDFLPKA